VLKAAARVDWKEFQATAERHRIAGIVWDALRTADCRVPEEVGKKLLHQAETIAAQGLQAALLSSAISAAMDAAGIRHLFVKGLLVGALAYGSPFIKHS
jgi:hypothetical protein